MNRKQRGLTIIVAILFVVIGVGHYLAWPPIHLFGTKYGNLKTVWKELTYAEAQNDPSTYRKDQDFIFYARLQDQGGWVDSKGQWQPYSDVLTSTTIPVDAKLWFPTKEYGSHTVWHPWFNGATLPYNAAMIRDVRLPWFMLGVVYVGLFFLLADRKDKR